MGKSARRKLHEKQRPHAHKRPLPYARPGAPSSSPSSKNKKPTTAKQHASPRKQKKQQTPDIPFSPHDSILLIGEGDFSFAASLITHYACADVLATCYDAEPALLAKHPQAAAHIATLVREDQRVLYGVDATKLTAHKEIRKRGSNDNSSGNNSGESASGGGGAGGGRWDRVVFNFPHVGGKSTDVNRQVRYNQELLVSFFKSAAPLLSPTGTIIVTLFEGEPYTLWNIRDLARHVGLRVGRSFQFQAAAYPDYHHARTLGNVAGGGGWKGEDRPARTYVFERGEGGAGAGGKSTGAADANGSSVTGNTKHKKEAAHDSASDDDD